MKLKILSDDGAIQGWVVSFIITACRMGMFIAAYFVPSIAETEIKIGAGFTTFALTSVGSWFAYRVARPLIGGGQ